MSKLPKGIFIQFSRTFSTDLETIFLIIFAALELAFHQTIVSQHELARQVLALHPLACAAESWAMASGLERVLLVEVFLVAAPPGHASVERQELQE